MESLGPLASMALPTHGYAEDGIIMPIIQNKGASSSENDVLRLAGCLLMIAGVPHHTVVQRAKPCKSEQVHGHGWWLWIQVSQQVYVKMAPHQCNQDWATGTGKQGT